MAACWSAGVPTTVGFPAADADDNDALSTAEYHEFFDDADGFERFDDDDNGTLNRTEYNEAVDTPWQTDASFTGPDRDSSGTLTRREFIDGWCWSHATRGTFLRAPRVHARVWQHEHGRPGQGRFALPSVSYA